MREHRTRLWICRQCYRIHHRKKAQRFFTCYVCRQGMAKIRKYPPATWFVQQEKKEARKYSVECRGQKRWGVPRNSKGKVLKLTREIKRLWRLISKAKHRDTFQRRATSFLIELHHKGIHQLGINGMCEPPEVVIHPRHVVGGSLKGRYSVGLRRGKYQIQIWETGLEDMKTTLLHEALHHIDSEANVPGKFCGHGFTWDRRLDDLKARLGTRAVKYVED